MSPAERTALSPGLGPGDIGSGVLSAPFDFPARRRWRVAALLSALLFVVFLVSVTVLFSAGIGVWGMNIPVNWGLAISNYVWWLGIGHAGTLISALLLLTQQDWRNSLNRFAEAMTLFAVLCASIYPLLHLGRPWKFYYMLPYPSTLDVWPQFRSPLVWDVFAVLTYLVVSVLFWYVGAIPDFAAARDRARRRRWQVFFGLIALGWRGTAAQWVRWRTAYRIVAALAVPLVVSVHSEVSMIFAAGLVPGWHTSLFPPYFVLGAAFSGFAVVAIIAIVLRAGLSLEALVTARHLDLLGRMLLATGLMTAYGYVFEVFLAFQSGGQREIATVMDRMTGEYAFAYWAAVVLNFVPLQLLWWGRVRRSPLALAAISLGVAVGMWFERYMLLATGLYRDFLVSSWGDFAASFWEWATFVGTFGLFLLPFALFVRFLPVISGFEVREALHDARGAREAAE